MYKSISSFTVASIYVGTIIGAGFASGREIWQYFGVFGSWGILGLAISGLMFMVMGMMVVYIGRKTQTHDIGHVILPFENKTAASILGYIVALIIYVALITMSAAGGAFTAQQFGIHRAVGGIIIVIMVIFTVLGNFHRISRVFNMLVPVLVIVVAASSICVLFTPVEIVEKTFKPSPSPLADNWFFAALVYLAYNMIGTIPIMARAGIHALDMKTALKGAALGGGVLFFMALVLLLALSKDPSFADSLDLPLLGMVGRLSKSANLVYSIVLFFSIYSAATSTFYGVTTKLREGPHKNKIIIGFALFGFALGMAGFRQIVAVVFPIVGFVGFFIIAMVIFNFFRVYNGHGRKLMDYNEQI